MSRLDAIYGRELGRRQRTHNLRTLQALVPTGPVHVQRGDRELVNFCSNNYLGLTHHPLLTARASEWARRWGCGSAASRLVCGTLELHEAIEDGLARLKRAEAALLFNSGYQANSSILPALLDRRMIGSDPLVFADELIHASLRLGCAAAGVRPIRFRHNDMNHLGDLLEDCTTGAGKRFILSESVFSMDGDRVDLPALLELADRYDAFLMLDEAHATGVLGPQGMGLSAEFPGRVDLVLGTFSKGLGSFGAYVSCSRTLRDYLVNRCGGLIYTTALPPPVLGAIDAALELVPRLVDERKRLHQHARQLRVALRAAGIDTLGSTTQIVPAVVGKPERALELAAELERRGLLGIAIRPPAVPRGTSRVRFCLSAAHAAQEVESLIEATVSAYEASCA